MFEWKLWTFIKSACKIWQKYNFRLLTACITFVPQSEAINQSRKLAKREPSREPAVHFLQHIHQCRGFFTAAARWYWEVKMLCNFWIYIVNMQWSECSHFHTILLHVTLHIISISFDPLQKKAFAWCNQNKCGKVNITKEFFSFFFFKFFFWGPSRAFVSFSIDFLKICQK